MKFYCYYTAPGSFLILNQIKFEAKKFTQSEREIYSEFKSLFECKSYLIEQIKAEITFHQDQKNELTKHIDGKLSYLRERIQAVKKVKWHKEIVRD